MIRVAVIGAGQWGPNLIRNLDNKNTSEVAWVVDRDPRRLEQVRTRFPDLGLSLEPADALKDESVDAAVIATPTVTHHSLVKAALQAGKHVLVEKPMTTDVAQAEELCALSAELGRTLMVGHVFIYNTAVRKVKEYLDSDHLGRVYYISMVRTNLGPIRMDVNAAWDLAAHDISMVNYWLQTEPLSASAVGGSWINTGIEDAVFATLRFPRGVLVNLHASWLNPRKVRDVTVVGEKRMITFDDMNLSEPIRIYDKRVSDERTTPAFVDSFASFRASIREGDVIIPKIALDEPLKAECDHFIECVTEGRPPVSGAAEGAAVVRALQAIAASAANAGREERIA